MKNRREEEYDPRELEELAALGALGDGGDPEGLGELDELAALGALGDEGDPEGLDEFGGMDDEEEMMSQMPSLAEMIRQLGEGEDTILAHINPMEAAQLAQQSQGGSINPITALPQFQNRGANNNAYGNTYGSNNSLFGSAAGPLSSPLNAMGSNPAVRSRGMGSVLQGYQNTAGNMNQGAMMNQQPMQPMRQPPMPMRQPPMQPMMNQQPMQPMRQPPMQPMMNQQPTQPMNQQPMQSMPMRRQQPRPVGHTY